jgi:hypothetical protein
VGGKIRKSLPSSLSMRRRLPLKSKLTAKWVSNPELVPGYSPQYAFAQDQVSLTSKTQVKAALSQITSKYGSLLLIPGTIAVKDAGNYTQNLCYAYRNGVKICSFGKKNGVGEVSEGSGLTFSGGQGYGTFTLDAVE